MLGHELLIAIDIDQARPQPVTYELLSSVVTEMTTDAGVEDDIVHRSDILGHLTARATRQSPRYPTLVDSGLRPPPNRTFRGPQRLARRAP